jgi:hypothetical protein
MAKEKIFTKEINPETFSLIYKNQASMAAKHILRKFRLKDFNSETKEHSGFIDF